MARFWISWYQPSEDYRPLTFPPNEAILGWWCTGYGESGTKALHMAAIGDPPRRAEATICALVEAASEKAAWGAVLKDWPDMGDRRFIAPRDPNHTINNNRFPLSDWMKARMKSAGEAKPDDQN